MNPGKAKRNNWHKPLSAVFVGALLAVGATFLLPGSSPDAHHNKEQSEHEGHQHAQHEQSPPAAVESSPHSNAEHLQPAAENSKAGSIYYCPMHPTYKSDRPGDCPICNMSLVPLENTDRPSASAVSGYSAVTIHPERRQLIGLRLGTVEKKEVFKNIRAAGRVEMSEEHLSTVNLKFSGWADELIVDATGDWVEIGSPLFMVYSPELLEAQKNYLVALHAQRAMPPGTPRETAAFAEQSVKSARERLRLWDISPEQLRELESRREPSPRMKVLSQVRGVVTKRNVVLGSYIQPGTDLYEIADLSVVWIYADIYVSEIAQIKVGQQAEITLTAYPERPFTAEVVYIYPYVNETTRTVRVRFAAQNREGQLRPGDFGTVMLRIPLGNQLVVDDQAVMVTGERQIAFVDQGSGKLEPREVTLGPHAGGLVVVLEGLHQGEQVVTSGNFLVDSESRLKAALSQGASGSHVH